MLTAERLRERLSYDEATGQFAWRSGGAGITPGAVGYVEPQGYLRVCVDGHEYRAHQLAWLYVYGELPVGIVDHRDQDKSNNRIANLRLVTSAQNTQNGKPARGAYRAGAKWRAEIRANGRRVHIGYFDTQDAAAQAYREAKAVLHIN